MKVSAFLLLFVLALISRNEAVEITTHESMLEILEQSLSPEISPFPSPASSLRDPTDLNPTSNQPSLAPGPVSSLLDPVDLIPTPDQSLPSLSPETSLPIPTDPNLTPDQPTPAPSPDYIIIPIEPNPSPDQPSPTLGPVYHLPVPVNPNPTPDSPPATSDGPSASPPPVQPPRWVPPFTRFVEKCWSSAPNRHACEEEWIHAFRHRDLLKEPGQACCISIMGMSDHCFYGMFFRRFDPTRPAQIKAKCRTVLGNAP